MKQTTLDLTQSPSYQRDDFVVSDCNMLVWQWLEKWPDWPSYGAVITGDVASGKTHLTHCWATKTKAMMIESSDAPTLPQHHIIIDHADLWQSSEAETYLFHLLNHCKEQELSVLMTAKTLPSDWPIQLKDLRSRLLSLPIWQLNPPDEALLAALLSKHFSDQQILVDPSVIQYIVTRTERSFEAITSIAANIDAYALEAKRPITTALVRSWMEEHC